MPLRFPDRLSTARAGASLLVALMAGTGCPQPCAEELTEGSSYSSTVVGPYGPGTRFPGSLPFNPGERPSCQAFDGLKVGARVTIQATGTYPAKSCETLTGKITEAPDTITLGQPSSANSAASFLSAASAISAAGCRGVWAIQLVNPLEGGALFDHPEEGKTPSVVMLRMFFADPESDRCRSCQDFLAVKFEKR